jgi:glucan phosphoethanolaminetransferase (alkaline phosphatase superfamily)
MIKLDALLPRLVALARWLSLAIIAFTSALIAWKVVGIWQGTLGLFPEFDNAIVGISSPWNPFYTYLLTCILCVLGALPMLRDRRNLGLPRLVIELVYFILSLYLLYAISRVVFATFSPEM